ncbi:MAG: hypothetical protein ACJ77K_09510 [Bacteroidia bacterium]|jgi:GLPGLI family protein
MKYFTIFCFILIAGLTGGNISCQSVNDTDSIISSGKIIYENILLSLPDSIPYLNNKLPESLALRIATLTTPKEVELDFTENKIRLYKTLDKGTSRSELIVIDTQLNAHSKEELFCYANPGVKYFCIEHGFPIDRQLETYPDNNGPQIEYLNEIKFINGYLCKKALVYDGYKKYFIYYTEQVKPNLGINYYMDVVPINGFIMEKIDVELASLDGFIFVTRVKSIDKRIIDDSLFRLPYGYLNINPIKADSLSMEYMKRKYCSGETNVISENDLKGAWVLKEFEPEVILNIQPGEDGKTYSKCKELSATRWSSWGLNDPVFVCGAYVFIGDRYDYRIFKYDSKSNTLTDSFNNMIFQKKIVN